MKTVEIKPIRENPQDYEVVRKRIEKLFRDEIYLPLTRAMGWNKPILQNSMQDLMDAISSGRITYYRGSFKGRFSAALSRELRQIGAQWDPKQGAWRIPQSKLPYDIRIAIASSSERFNKTLELIEKKLEDMVPADIAGKIGFKKFFDTTLWKTEKKFQDSVKNITIAPSLTDHQRARIASEYSQNMQLYIQEFTEKEIKELRVQVQKVAFEGQRYEGLAKTIQKSYGVSQNKAKFLARQETSLLMTKYKQTRYQDAGSNEYKWVCRKHPKDTSPNQHTPGNVRYYHGLNDGKTFSWSEGAPINEKGERKNPGQDYNCYCTAVPIVRF